MGPNTAYQLKITILGIEPPIWRRVLVPTVITFHKLHKIIQAAFGWQDCHLFNFDFGDVVIHVPDPDYAPGEQYGGAKELSAKRTKIDDLLHEHKKCIYTYDLGDNGYYLSSEKPSPPPKCGMGTRAFQPAP